MASDKELSAIDRALAAAKARKLAKAQPDGTLTMEGNAPVKRQAKSDGDKNAEREAKEAERAAKKAEREAAKAAKDAERLAKSKPAHMGKVLKAAAKLPILNDAAQLSFNELTANFTAAQLAAIALHIEHFNRVKATERALTAKVKENDVVEIVSGNPRFVGLTGVVTKAQRIRCYVEVEGHDKELYLFTSDVRVVADADSVSTDEDVAPEANEPATSDEVEATGTEG